MPGHSCAIYGCRNTSALNKNYENERKIIMHSFPKLKDLVSQTIRKEWVRRCSRKDKFNPDTSRICSTHFVETDYERDLQHELLGLPLRNKLKKTAVPTVEIPIAIPKQSKPCSRNAKRRRKEITDDLITKAASVENQQEEKLSKDILVTTLILQENTLQTSVQKETNTITEESNSHTTTTPILKDIDLNSNKRDGMSYLLLSSSGSSCSAENIKDDTLQTSVQKETNTITEESNSHTTTTPILKDIDLNSNKRDGMSYLLLSTSGSSCSAENIKDDEQKYSKLLNEHIQIQHNLRKKIKSLNDQLRYFKKKSCKTPKLIKTQKNIIDAQTILKKVFTENQIALLSNKKKRINWTNEEISIAFTLLHYSKECYLFLKDKLHYPLPSLSTLNKMVYKARSSQGILKDVPTVNVETCR